MQNAMPHAAPEYLPNSGEYQPVLPEYLSTREGARLLDVSESSLRQSRTTGRLLSEEAPQWVKLGRSVRYRRRDLLEWAERVAVECRAAQG